VGVWVRTFDGNLLVLRSDKGLLQKYPELREMSVVFDALFEDFPTALAKKTSRDERQEKVSEAPICELMAHALPTPAPPV
jgi:hypothetical protein